MASVRLVTVRLVNSGWEMRDCVACAMSVGACEISVGACEFAPLHRSGDALVYERYCVKNLKPFPDSERAHFLGPEMCIWHAGKFCLRELNNRTHQEYIIVGSVVQFA